MKKAEEILEFYLKENGTISFTKDQKDLIACMMREYANAYSIQKESDVGEK